MKYNILALILILNSSDLFAQASNPSYRALDYSLIQGEQNRQKILSHSRAERYHYAPNHYRISSGLVVDYAYGKMYQQSKKERKVLLNALHSANMEQGISLDEIHAIVATQLKDILTYNQYQHWLNLASYPEYEYFLE
jgi:hypothetical protein